MSEMIERFWEKVAIGMPNQCWPWLAGTQRNRSGILYGYFRDGRMRRAHRVAWELTNNQHIPPGLVVRHSCDNGLCCNAAHLSLGTQQENVADRYARGRDNHLRGSAHSLSKLTEEDVAQIKHLLVMGRSQREIGRLFGVSQFPIQEIANGRAWRHV